MHLKFTATILLLVGTMLLGWLDCGKFPSSVGEKALK